MKLCKISKSIKLYFLLETSDTTAREMRGLGIFVLITYVSARIRSSNTNPWIPETSDDAIPDPSYLMAEIHSPNPSVSFNHQLSRSFLRITKDILSLKPRIPSGQSEDVDNTLNVLKNLSPEELSLLLSEQGIVQPSVTSVSCDQISSSYRTMDGSCNNFANPCWGKAEEPYQRWLTPDYANGIDEPRKSVDGIELPNPREVYLRVSSDFEPGVESQISYITNLFVTWGQFLAHEITFTPTATVKVWDGQTFVDKKLTCCNATTHHPDCWPLFLNHLDVYYPIGHCMEFVRSVAYAHRASSCTNPVLGQRREQLNQLTAFIDASVIYGSSDKEMRQLREHNGRGARLEMVEMSGRPYLPRTNRTCKSLRDTCDKRCHLGGEKRINENPSLAAMHTIFARQHNRLVEQLRSRGWDEETLFHVVRKIVGAQLQHITYKEYVPLLMSDNLSGYMGLRVPSENYSYDAFVNPTLMNSFVTAAFRCGHSMISSRQKRLGRRLIGSPSLSQDFFSMDDYCDSETDSVTRLLGGQAEQNIQNVDAIFTKELTNHLFAKRPEGPGLDLFSINIQRGRDHGIPSYNRWRKVCGLRPAQGFNDLRQDIPDIIVDRLATIYRDVNDVDLYIGGVAESPVNNALLGPTFTCIISNQLRNLKYGDRFWYENLNHPGAFTQEQLMEIRKTSLSSLICANSEVGSMQGMAFVSESDKNPKWPCEVILHKHELNLNMW